MTQEEFESMIEWGNCKSHCKGGQHVSLTCSYVIGEINDLNLIVKYDGSRSMIKNKQVVKDTLWLLYLEMTNNQR